jgi:starch phosphorylase
MQINLITGISGSGKSVALRAFEDAGYDCVDNLPVSLLESLITTLESEKCERVAVAIDARRGQSIENLPLILENLRRNHQVRVVFLNANTNTLVQRFSETRRRHPLSSNAKQSQSATLIEAIEKERQLLETLRAQAHSIDTSNIPAHALRSWIQDLLKDKPVGLTVIFESFGFKKGVPSEADYLRIKNGLADGLAPRTVIFGGKAAPGYYMAKLIIRFLNGIADTINADPDMEGRLRVVFLPDYNVKLGERVYPAADLSEQISTAGLEASGTGNMKFAMNGALTIGTLDGANVEIREQVGAENFFLFGKTTEEINALRQAYRPWELITTVPELPEVLRLIEQGHFSNGDGDLFRPLLENLTGRDPFFVLADFQAYLAAQDEVDRVWADRELWNRMSLLNTARSGMFSSDRSIREYAERIWQAEAFPVTITCEPE